VEHWRVQGQKENRVFYCHTPERPARPDAPIHAAVAAALAKRPEVKNVDATAFAKDVAKALGISSSAPGPPDRPADAWGLVAGGAGGGVASRTRGGRSSARVGRRLVRLVHSEQNRRALETGHGLRRDLPRPQ